MTNENFKDEYIDKDDYLFQSEIDEKNLNLFRFILVVVLTIFVYTTYLVVNRVFFNKEHPAPKLLLVLYILVISFFYLVYHTFPVQITNIIVNNSYPI